MVRLYTVSTVQRTLEIKARRNSKDLAPIFHRNLQRVNELDTGWGGFQGEHLTCPHLPPSLSLLTSRKAIGELSDFTVARRA